MNPGGQGDHDSGHGVCGAAVARVANPAAAGTVPPDPPTTPPRDCHPRTQWLDSLILYLGFFSVSVCICLWFQVPPAQQLFPSRRRLATRGQSRPATLARDCAVVDTRTAWFPDSAVVITAWHFPYIILRLFLTTALGTEKSGVDCDFPYISAMIAGRNLLMAVCDAVWRSR